MKLTPTQKRKINGLLREICIARDGGEKCLYCGGTNTLQLSHIYPKGSYRRMEYDPMNVKLLCMRHHLYWWHRNPVEAKEWLDTNLPKERLSYLKMKANIVDKSPFDAKLWILYLEQELRKLYN